MFEDVVFWNVKFFVLKDLASFSPSPIDDEILGIESIDWLLFPNEFNSNGDPIEFVCCYPEGTLPNLEEG